MLQYTLFDQQLVDNRSARQKRAERDHQKPSQLGMFKDKELFQFGVTGPTKFELSPHMLLPMMLYDPRTEEQKEADQLAAALAATPKLFRDYQVKGKQLKVRVYPRKQSKKGRKPLFD